ncbi:unnamed protein product [Nezara viridula]|uniref:Neuropeptide n=1 Tax=Nezara viridula TaxID=85310 RepID=A0A9P0MY58_NEZVI|nr:unnamed protein product [Nezara viridula]
MFLAVCFMLLSNVDSSPRTFKHVAPRVASKFFLRMNTKVDVVPYTAIFAYASGFRLNWDIRPTPSSSLFYVWQRSHVHDSISTVLERAEENTTCPAEHTCPISLLSLAYLVYGKDHLVEDYNIIT